MGKEAPMKTLNTVLLEGWITKLSKNMILQREKVVIN